MRSLRDISSSSWKAGAATLISAAVRSVTVLPDNSLPQKISPKILAHFQRLSKG